VDVDGPDDERRSLRTAKSFGPDTPALVSSFTKAFREATVARKPFTGESSKKTVKPLRWEGRSVSAEPVCSCSGCFRLFEI
jgi:hypothetical protein